MYQFALRPAADKNEISVCPCPTAAGGDRQERFLQIAFLSACGNAQAGGSFFYPLSVV